MSEQEPTPAQQASTGAGKGGVVPPPEHRWKAGESGNPAGRPTAGASVRDWINQMREWPLEKVSRVFEDSSASMSKRAAARVWLDAASRMTNLAGSPIAGAELDRIIGHTEVSVGDAEKYRRLDEGKATDSVVSGVIMRVVGPRRDQQQPPSEP